MAEQRNDEVRGAPVGMFAPRDLYIKEVDRRTITNLVQRGRAEGLNLGEVLRALVVGYARGDVSIIHNHKLKDLHNRYLEDHKRRHGGESDEVRETTRRQD